MAVFVALEGLPALSLVADELVVALHLVFALVAQPLGLLVVYGVVALLVCATGEANLADVAELVVLAGALSHVVGEVSVIEISQAVVALVFRIVELLLGDHPGLLPLLLHLLLLYLTLFHRRHLLLLKLFLLLHLLLLLLHLYLTHPLLLLLLLHFPHVQLLLQLGHLLLLGLYLLLQHCNVLLLRDLGLIFAFDFVLLLVLAELLALRLELGKGDQLSLLGDLLLPLYGSHKIALVGLLLQRRVLLLQVPP